MDKIQAARLALEKIGGPKEAAEKLTELMGEEVTRHVTDKWEERGVGSRYAPFMSTLSGVSLHDLLGIGK